MCIRDRTWYNDGIEGEVMRSLLDRFEAQNSDIKVTLDVVPYQSIMESLPVQLAAGDGPDIARVTDLGGLSKYYMDLRPHLSDAGYWEKSFGPFLKWLRQPGDTSAISGFMTQLTVTGPYVTRLCLSKQKCQCLAKEPLGMTGPRPPSR